jgi:hypothetical protein
MFRNILNLFSTAWWNWLNPNWSGPNGFVSTQNPSISNVSTAASGSYMLTVTDKMLAITANINILLTQNPLVQQLLNLSVVQDYKCCTKLDSNRNNVYLDRYTTDISGGGTITGQLTRLADLQLHKH